VELNKRWTKELERLLRRAHEDAAVLAVLLFGSAARGELSSHSDIDVCLVLEPQPKSYARTSLSRKRLEYLQHFDLDVHVFQQLPLYIRRRVLKEGQVLFVRDEDLLYDVAFRTAQAFEDFKHIYYEYLERVAYAGS